MTRRRGAAARRSMALSALILASSVLVGCSGDPNSVSELAKNSDGRGDAAGHGAIEQIAPDRRGEPVQLTGPLLDGGSWSSRKEQGKVVVLSVWGSWCGPCQAELPRLQQAWTQLSAAHPDVRFLGIDTGESAATGQAVVQRFGLTYPQLSDPDRTVPLSLQGKAAATPTTLVLDRKGRIAARVSGEVTAESTVVGLVQDVLKET
ncbi:Thiol-disulfide oxidoreductase ResA [Austwickia sp. TVS 96-490-7B]|uniref:TlpA family protein disulfide reductase n=1 Tax=Austwickia sp. TVS 96-490-7B TaxID=2830843 RepID=UPI001C58ED2C|nr:TlpA disulfide reductase family protein [Austwickia sp. TVS 96-490-7B]MBW3084775.1 Thiol-disulfide oxidoreductase ResA [Austwickia sp. TVS 96-490-7B]